MKNLKFLLIGFLLVPALFLTSCDRGDDLNPENPIATPAFTLMKDYMITNDLDIDNIMSGPGGAVKFVTGAPAEADLATFIDKYYIMDIRNGDDFSKGHIQGAHNVAFGDILTEADKATKQILVVCYSGQTACYATSLLRLYGYSNTQALKWGMSGWNETTAGPWNNQIDSNPADGNANWNYSSAPSTNIFKDPSISSLSQDGSEILLQRIESVIAAGFKTASNGDVLASPSNYFVNNYFTVADYDDFGHIANAYRIKEELLLEGNGYLEMDPDSNAKIVSYCYTGQTSAVLTAWLNVLGYDAYSLTYGMNGLYNSNNAWDKANLNQWGVGSHPKALPLVQ
ncbi:MAG: hypothetical protein KAH67_03350 [Flavobacteriaceae bacterium]|nr:hypothetical protein [Flavobacteriaceae bacterium]